MGRGATAAELVEVAPATLRALIREKVHHTLETAVELFARQGRRASATLGHAARQHLAEWERRNLSDREPDIVWAREWLCIAQRYIDERRYENPPHPPAMSREQLTGLERAIKERRSVRIWRDDDVPDALVDRVLEAATWAPTACNQQPVRYIVVRDKETIKMIPGDGCFEFAPVIIIVLLDRRSYAYLNTIPAYNPVMDAGAAIQNMLLLAYGLGLGTTWGTFTADKRTQAVRDRLRVPDYLEMLTYVGLGVPADFPPAPGRMRLAHVAVRESWHDGVDGVEETGR